MVTQSDERTALEDLTRRLGERYPSVAPEVVRAAVEEAAAGFAQAHVRDFVPVLVERRVKQALRPLALA